MAYQFILNLPDSEEVGIYASSTPRMTFLFMRDSAENEVVIELERRDLLALLAGVTDRLREIPEETSD